MINGTSGTIDNSQVAALIISKGKKIGCLWLPWKLCFKLSYCPLSVNYWLTRYASIILIEPTGSEFGTYDAALSMVHTNQASSLCLLRLMQENGYRSRQHQCPMLMHRNSWAIKSMASGPRLSCPGAPVPAFVS